MSAPQPHPNPRPSDEALLSMLESGLPAGEETDAFEREAMEGLQLLGAEEAKRRAQSLRQSLQRSLRRKKARKKADVPYYTLIAVALVLLLAALSYLLIHFSAG